MNSLNGCKKHLAILLTLLFLCTSIFPVLAENNTPVNQIESTETPTTEIYPFGVVGTVIVAIIGLVGGIVGSIFTPWVNWRIEKRRLKHTRKLELVKEWRNFIESFDFENHNFGNSTVYGAMRPYMDEKVVKKFEAQRIFFVPPDGGRGNQLSKQWASDQVAMIEHKWELI